jgi:D-glycero-D-manno-heptose 1,7-bisphosphate phosphatase
MPEPRTLDRAGSTPGPTGGEMPAAFIDRDGTIIAERYYLADPARAELIPGAADALRRLHDAGYALVIVTNQSGIARGLYGVDDFLAVQRRVDELLDAEGVSVEGVYYCPHHPDFTGACRCRKPAVGLFEQAAAELHLSLRESVFIGDRLKDVLPALRLGGGGILVRTGYGAEQERDAPVAVLVVDTLADAVDAVLEHRSRERGEAPKQG